MEHTFVGASRWVCSSVAGVRLGSICVDELYIDKTMWLDMSNYSA